MKEPVYRIAKGFLLRYISWMNLRGMIPIRTSMGSGKEKSISRAYVELFTLTNKSLIQGDILEIGRKVYSNIVQPENIRSYSCLDIAEFPDVDLIADIQNMPQIESYRFDTIICTQVLEHVPNPFDAMNELYRILRPKGRLLITVPFLNNYHMEPNDYWRFTEYGLAALLRNFSNVTVASHGATYHHVTATLGYRASEVNLGIPERAGVPKFPVIISAIAQK